MRSLATELGFSGAALDRLLTEHPGEPLRIFCTYTAMMRLRRILAERYDLPEIGEDAPA